MNNNNSLKYARVITLVMMALAFLPSQGLAQDIFAELSGMEAVESTYVSGRFAHAQRYLTNKDGTHRIALNQGFSSLYSYQCYSEQSVAMAKKILKKYLKDNPNVEVVMKNTQGVLEYAVYEKFIDNGNKVSQMIIWSSDGPCAVEVSVINWKKGIERTKSEYEDSEYEDSDNMDD